VKEGEWIYFMIRKVFWFEDKKYKSLKRKGDNRESDI